MLKDLAKVIIELETFSEEQMKEIDHLKHQLVETYAMLEMYTELIKKYQQKIIELSPSQEGNTNWDDFFAPGNN
jgi:uncharacterized coiled-coil protein SlyX